MHTDPKMLPEREDPGNGAHRGWGGFEKKSQGGQTRQAMGFLGFRPEVLFQSGVEYMEGGLCVLWKVTGGLGASHLLLDCLRRARPRRGGARAVPRSAGSWPPAHLPDAITEACASLTGARRGYGAMNWYCSDPKLAFLPLLLPCLQRKTEGSFFSCLGRLQTAPVALWWIPVGYGRGRGWFGLLVRAGVPSSGDRACRCPARPWPPPGPGSGGQLRGGACWVLAAPRGPRVTLGKSAGCRARRCRTVSLRRRSPPGPGVSVCGFPRPGCFFFPSSQTLGSHAAQPDLQRGRDGPELLRLLRGVRVGQLQRRNHL